MDNEPERPIERLLRRVAKKRREQVGGAFELHPADRRLLQGEMARTFAKAQRERRGFQYRLARLWPVCVGAVGILAVLGMAVWLLLPGPRHEQAAIFPGQGQPVTEPGAAQEPTPPSAPAIATPPAEIAAAPSMQPAVNGLPRQLETGPPQAAKDLSAAQEKGEVRERLALAPGTQAPEGQPSVALQFPSTSGMPAPAAPGTANGRDAERYGLAFQPPPAAGVPSPSAAPGSVATASPAAGLALAPGQAKPADQSASLQDFQFKSLPATDSAAPSASTANAGSAANAFAISQRFVQAAPAANVEAVFAKKAAPAQAVLASFKVEQNGSQLRIVDGDGSVYNGYLQFAGGGQGAPSGKAGALAGTVAGRVPEQALDRKSPSRLVLDQLASQSWNFRVAGTNRSLNQKVVFTGDLLPTTNAISSEVAATNLSLGAVMQQTQNAPAQPGLPPLRNSRISGKVVIDDGKAVEINALPAGQ